MSVSSVEGQLVELNSVEGEFFKTRIATELLLTVVESIDGNVMMIAL